MATFSKKKNLLEQGLNLIGVGNTKLSKNNTVYSSSIRDEGQKSNPYTSNQSIYGVKKPQPIDTRQSKQVPNPYNSLPYNLSKSPQPTAQPKIEQPQGVSIDATRNQKTFDNGMVPPPATNYNQNIQNIRSQAVEQAGQRGASALQRYQEYAPQVAGLYDERIKGYQQQQADINRRIAEVQAQQGDITKQIEQQYGQQIQETGVQSEEDLRRAAEARRVQQAQLEQKFANLGTLGSTGYYGQSGETQRSESEFLRGQQDIMASKTRAINDLNIQKNNAIQKAQSDVNDIVNKYRDTINEISQNINIALGEKIKMANDLYSNLEKTLSDIDSGLRTEIAGYDKQAFDMEQEQGKIGADKQVAQESKNQIMGVVNTLLSRDTGAITGVPNLWKLSTGEGQLTANYYNQLKGLLSLENRQKLKGSGAISDYESKVLDKAASALGRNLRNEDFVKVLQDLKNELQGGSQIDTSEINTLKSAGFTDQEIADYYGGL